MKYFRLTIGSEIYDYVIDFSHPEIMDDFINKINFLESQSIDYSCKLVTPLVDLCSLYDSFFVSILRTVSETNDFKFQDFLVGQLTTLYIIHKDIISLI